MEPGIALAHPLGVGAFSFESFRLARFLRGLFCGAFARLPLAHGAHAPVPLRTALFGNVVLSRFPVKHHIQHDLTWKTCEHRGVQRVDVSLDEDTLHVYNVHLGTSLLERRHQAVKLASIVHDRRVAGPKIVLGDFNEWARGMAKDVLAERLQSIDLSKHLSRRRTYPGFFPILHLDHIYYEGKVEVLKVSLPRDRMALMASDHLPLVADLRIGFD